MEKSNKNKNKNKKKQSVNEGKKCITLFLDGVYYDKFNTLKTGINEQVKGFPNAGEAASYLLDNYTVDSKKEKYKSAAKYMDKKTCVTLYLTKQYYDKFNKLKRGTYDQVKGFSNPADVIEYMLDKFYS